MYPFYNTNQRLFPFPFFPFPGTGLNRRRRLNRISGIPVLKTTGVTASTTEVRYDVNEEDWRALPNEGLFFLDVRQEVPTASADLPVTLKAEESTPAGTSMLRSALAEDVQAGDLKMTIRYMIYYNKCTKSYQLINSYPANIPTAAA